MGRSGDHRPDFGPRIVRLAGRRDATTPQLAGKLPCEGRLRRAWWNSRANPEAPARSLWGTPGGVALLRWTAGDGEGRGTTTPGCPFALYGVRAAPTGGKRPKVAIVYPLASLPQKTKSAPNPRHYRMTRYGLCFLVMGFTGKKASAACD